MEELKLILEMGENAGNAFYYWIGFQVFSSITGTILFLAFFYLIYRIALMFLLNLKVTKALREIGELLDELFYGEPTNSEIKAIINRLKNTIENSK